MENGTGNRVGVVACKLMASFVDGSRWLDIASHLHGRQLTMSALARSMGLHTSTIYRQVQAMQTEGLLACTVPDGGKGAEYWVPDELVKDMELELADAQPVGEIVRGQVGVKVDTITDLRATAEILSSPGSTSVVLWAIEIAAPGEGYLLILSRSATSAAVGALRIALEAAGNRCHTVRFGDRMSVEALRALATAWRDVGDSHAGQSS